VPAERVSMRKTHEVLRLHFDLKLKQRQIARSANLSQSTVHEYLRRFRAAGLSWPLPEQMSEAELEAALFSVDAKPPRAPAPNLPALIFLVLLGKLSTIILAVGISGSGSSPT